VATLRTRSMLYCSAYAAGLACLLGLLISVICRLLACARGRGGRERGIERSERDRGA
jgi:hypothetical protein